MKIQIISDVHTEFHPDRGKAFWKNIPVNGDVLVIAGDLGTAGYLTENLAFACEKFPHVVYVTGNHEYWGAKGYHVVKAAMEELAAKFSNFHWLLDSAVEIDGIRFLGNTMWFKGDGLAQLYERAWSDFKRIKGASHWIYKANSTTRGYLRNEVKKGDVVVTHHLPCDLSIHPDYKSGPMSWQNMFYVCDMSGLILDKAPAAWIHGHTHTHNDYMLGETRIVSNPRGYVGYEHLAIAAHDPGFCIEVNP